MTQLVCVLLNAFPKATPFLIRQLQMKDLSLCKIYLTICRRNTILKLHCYQQAILHFTMLICQGINTRTDSFKKLRIYIFRYRESPFQPTKNTCSLSLEDALLVMMQTSKCQQLNIFSESDYNILFFRKIKAKLISGNYNINYNY